jgi:hypothetical protein
MDFPFGNIGGANVSYPFNIYSPVLDVGKGCRLSADSLNAARRFLLSLLEHADGDRDNEKEPQHLWVFCSLAVICITSAACLRTPTS